MNAEPGETPTTSPDELAALLMAFDKNGDGNLEKSEVPERMVGIFDRADVNKDGKVNADEIKKSAAAASHRMPWAARDSAAKVDGWTRRHGPRWPGGPGGVDPLVNALDLNHDGTLQSDELAGAPPHSHARQNKDGQLTGDEHRQMGPGRQTERIR
jgi:Ca2+-binding EF-hand superfamily protein